MFLFDQTKNPYSTRTASFDAIHEVLRTHGCHSPTDTSLIEVFDALKSLCMLEKLKNPMGQIRVISSEMLIQRLNGPTGKLDHSQSGCENSGWYTELLTLEAARLITIDRSSIVILPKFFEFTNRKYNEEQHETNLLETLNTREIKLRVTTNIVKRIKEQSLVNFILGGVYAER